MEKLEYLHDKWQFDDEGSKSIFNHCFNPSEYLSCHLSRYACNRLYYIYQSCPLHNVRIDTK